MISPKKEQPRSDEINPDYLSPTWMNQAYVGAAELSQPGSAHPSLWIVKNKHLSPLLYGNCPIADGRLSGNARGFVHPDVPCLSSVLPNWLQSSTIRILTQIPPHPQPPEGNSSPQAGMDGKDQKAHDFPREGTVRGSRFG